MHRVGLVVLVLVLILVLVVIFHDKAITDMDMAFHNHNHNPILIHTTLIRTHIVPNLLPTSTLTHTHTHINVIVNEKLNVNKNYEKKKRHEHARDVRDGINKRLDMSKLRDGLVVPVLLRVELVVYLLFLCLLLRL